MENLKELNLSEITKEASVNLEGGFLFLIPLATIALAGATVATIGAFIYGGFQSGEDHAHNH